MRIGITDPESKKEHLIEWGGNKPPNDEELQEILGTIRSTPPPTSFAKNLGQDIVRQGKGIALSTAQPLAQIGSQMADIATGGSIRKLMGQKADTNIPDREMEVGIKEAGTKGILKPAIEQLTRPAISENVEQTQQAAPQAAEAYKERYGKGLGEAIYKEPVGVGLDVAMLASGLGAGIKGLTKEGVKAPVETLPSTKLASMNLQDRTLVNSDKVPTIRKMLREGFGPEEIEMHEQKFQTSLDKIREDIPKVGSKLYKDAGITDKLPVNIENPTLMKINGEQVMMSPVERMENAVEAFGVRKSPTSKAIFEDAKQHLESIIKEKQYNFGDMKEMIQELQDLSEKYSADKNYGASSMYAEMKKSLVEARNSIPEMKKVSAKYHDLMNAKELLDDVLRLSADSGEITAAKKISRRYKEATNVEFNNQIDKLAEILEKNPESAGMSSFVDDVKTLQAVTDITKAKPWEIGIPFVKDIPVIGKLAKLKLSPRTQGQILSYAKPGVFSTSRTAKTKGFIYGPKITKLKAYADIAGIKVPKMPIKQASIAGLIAASQNRGEK